MSATSFQVKNSLVVNGAITVNSTILDINTASLSINGGLGTTGQVVTSNGSSVSWSTIPITPPPGSNTQIAFNNSGSFAASGGLTFNYVTNNVMISNTITIGNTSVNSSLITVGNSSVNTHINSSAFSVSGNIITAFTTPIITTYATSPAIIVIPSGRTRAWVRMIAGGYVSSTESFTGGYLEKVLSGLTPGLYLNGNIGLGQDLIAGGTSITSGTQGIVSLVCPANAGFPSGGDWAVQALTLNSLTFIPSMLGAFGASGNQGVIIIMWFP